MLITSHLFKLRDILQSDNTTVPNREIKSNVKLVAKDDLQNLTVLC